MYKLIPLSSFSRRAFDNILDFSYNYLFSLQLGINRDRDHVRLMKTKFAYPPLNENDLKETYIRGHGPGGQATNKTNNCVVLRHIPTGLIIKCHQTRSLEENKKIARYLMQKKLDYHYYGDQCQEAIQKVIDAKLKKQKELKTKERLLKIKEFKEREGID